jgi:hypothetical protein
MRLGPRFNRFAVRAPWMTVRNRHVKVEGALRAFEIEQCPVLHLDLAADDLEGAAKVVGKRVNEAVGTLDNIVVDIDSMATTVLVAEFSGSSSAGAVAR